MPYCNFLATIQHFRSFYVTYNNYNKKQRRPQPCSSTRYYRLTQTDVQIYQHALNISLEKSQTVNSDQNERIFPVTVTSQSDTAAFYTTYPRRISTSHTVTVREQLRN